MSSQQEYETLISDLRHQIDIEKRSKKANGAHRLIAFVAILMILATFSYLLLSKKMEVDKPSAPVQYIQSSPLEAIADAKKDMFHLCMHNATGELMKIKCLEIAPFDEQTGQ